MLLKPFRIKYLDYISPLHMVFGISHPAAHDITDLHHFGTVRNYHRFRYEKVCETRFMPISPGTDEGARGVSYISYPCVDRSDRVYWGPKVKVPHTTFKLNTYRQHNTDLQALACPKYGILRLTKMTCAFKQTYFLAKPHGIRTC